MVASRKWSFCTSVCSRLWIQPFSGSLMESTACCSLLSLPWTLECYCNSHSAFSVYMVSALSLVGWGQPSSPICCCSHISCQARLAFGWGNVSMRTMLYLQESEFHGCWEVWNLGQGQMTRLLISSTQFWCQQNLFHLLSQRVHTKVVCVAQNFSPAP